MAALDGHLDQDEHTVGIHVGLTHQAPTPPGDTVTIDVELTAAEGRRLTFTVHAADAAGTICEGTHQRAVISLERFERGLATRVISDTSRQQA